MTVDTSNNVQSSDNSSYETNNVKKVTSTVSEHVLAPVPRIKSASLSTLPTIPRETDREIERSTSLRNSQNLNLLDSRVDKQSPVPKKKLDEKGEVTKEEDKVIEEEEESDLDNLDSSSEKTISSTEQSTSGTPLSVGTGTNTPEEKESNIAADLSAVAKALEKIEDKSRVEDPPLPHADNGDIKNEEDEDMGIAALFGEDIQVNQNNGGPPALEDDPPPPPLDPDPGLVIRVEQEEPLRNRRRNPAKRRIAADHAQRANARAQHAARDEAARQARLAGAGGAAAAPAPIGAAQVQPIQAAAAVPQANDPRSTAGVLQQAMNSLKGLIPNDPLVSTKTTSHLARDPDGSYKIEVYTPTGSDEIRYKIKATYTITLTRKDAQGKDRVVLDNSIPPQAVQVTVERDIYIKTFVKAEDVPFLASKYKDTLIQLAEQNSSGRLGGYNAGNNADLVGQHDFTFSLSRDPQTGLKALKSISTTIPVAPGGAPIKLELRSKAVRANTLYVRDPLDTTAADKRKIKRTKNVDLKKVRFVSGKSVYRTKDEALQHAEYKIEDSQDYAHFINKDLDVNLIRLEDEVQKKQAELEALEATFKKSSYLGFRSKNTPEYEEFLTETLSQTEPDNLKWENNQTKFLELTRRRKNIKSWNKLVKVNIEKGIKGIEDALNPPDNRNAEPITPELRADIRGQQLSVKQKLENLKAVKQDLTQDEKNQIDALIAIADDQRDAALAGDASLHNAAIRAALIAQDERIKQYSALQTFKKMLSDKADEERDLEADEAQYQAKRDVFNSKLIRLEKGQKDLDALVERLERLKSGAEAGMLADPNEGKHQLVLKDITAKKIKELDKQATHYKELITKLHHEFRSVGANIPLPVAGVVIGGRP